MYRKLFGLAAALLLLSAAGCGLVGSEPATSEQNVSSEEGADASLPAADGERLYSIPLGSGWISGSSWVIDRDGNERQKDEASKYIELTDLATDEPRYKYRTRYEDTKKLDEWGSPVIRTLRALYDMDGNQLSDWEEMDYYSAFGEYIIRQDRRGMMIEAPALPEGHHTALYHVPTGEDAIVGVANVVKLDNDAFLLSDVLRLLLGVVDAGLNKLSGFPPPKTYYSAYAWNGYFIASMAKPYMETKDETNYILDRDFRELFAAQWISSGYGNMSGDNLVFHNGEDFGVYHPDGGVLFEVNGASIEYYDGELAIVQKGSFRSNEDPINAALVAAPDGREIAGGFSWLVPVQIYYSKGPAEKFFGITGSITGARAVMIDRSGAELASREIPAIVSINTVAEGPYATYSDSRGEGLFGPDLDIIVPSGSYTYFDILTDYKLNYGEIAINAENALIRAGRDIGDSDEPGRSIHLMDILDFSGRVIADNIHTIYDVGPNRIALRRGFDIGLMDWDGNWIVKRRIFTGFGDD